MDGEVWELCVTLTKVNVSNPLFNSIKGTGMKHGSFNLLIRSQLLFDVGRSR